MNKHDETGPDEPQLIDIAGGAEPAPAAEAAEAGAAEPSAAPQVETIGTPSESDPTPEPDFEDEGEEAEGAGSIFDSELMRVLTTPAGLKSAIESLLFVSPEPLTPHRISRALEVNDIKLVTAALTNLRIEYEDQKRGMQIVETVEGYQMATREVFGDLILRLKNRKRRPALSQAALETLAIIAYRQPIIRADVEAVRGVESSGTIRNLIDMGLVEMVGRKEVLGRPPMYGTSEQFLQSFGLRSLSDLPPIGELKRRFAEKEEKDAQESKAAAAAAAAAATAPPPAAAGGDGATAQTPDEPHSEPEANTSATPEPVAAAQSQIDEAPEAPDGATPDATDGAAEPEESIMTKREQWDDEEDFEARQPDEDEDDEEFEDDEDEDFDDEDEEDEDDEGDDEDEDDEDEDVADEDDEDEDDDEGLEEDELEDDEDYEDEDEDEFDDEDEDEDEDDEEDEDEEEDQGRGRKKR